MEDLFLVILDPFIEALALDCFPGLEGVDLLVDEFDAGERNVLLETLDQVL